MGINDINHVATLYKGDGRYEVHATDRKLTLYYDTGDTIESRKVHGEPLHETSKYILELIKRGFILHNSIEDIYIILDGQI